MVVCWFIRINSIFGSSIGENNFTQAEEPKIGFQFLLYYLRIIFLFLFKIQPMNIKILNLFIIVFFSLTVFAQKSSQSPTGKKNSSNNKSELRDQLKFKENQEHDNDQTDKPYEAFLFEFNKTKNPISGKVPKERLLKAIESAKSSKMKRQEFLKNSKSTSRSLQDIVWTERGPNNIGGRSRALIFDLSDSINYLKVWAGGVSGGLWYTNNISATTPQWNKVNDRFENMAITCIAQSKLTKNVMYFGTGEGWFNIDAVKGFGIWKSIDGGLNWSQLSSTANEIFSSIQKIVIDNQNNIFACTSGGLQKSSDGGATWTKVLGVGVNNGDNDFAADLEIAPNGVLYCSLGNLYYTGKIYKSNNSGLNWVDISPANINANRIELASCPNNSDRVYALIQSSTSNDCDYILRFSVSTNLWTICTVPTIIDQGSNSNFARGQAWYDLIAAVDPNNSNNIYIGGVDALRSNDGGITWTQMTNWSLYAASGFTSSQNVHADHHAIVYAPGSSSRAIWGTDGGVYYTVNANRTGSKPTWTSKNTGYNVTQYYSNALHPTSTNYFLAGAQDNGTHKFSTAGINTVTEASGGDGGFCHIDKDNPLVQITSYTYNNYFVSTNGGINFPFFNKNDRGQFINPSDYDNVNNILYSGDAAGSFYRWKTPPNAGTDDKVSVVAFNNSEVTHVAISPVTSNRVFFGLNNGSVVMVNNAHLGTALTGKVIMPADYYPVWISCIAIDSADENHLMVTTSNYGVYQIWETRTALQTTPVWTSITGNLPDMPVRWCMFYPNNANRAIIATETGVWTTDLIDGDLTSWDASTSFPNVRTDMLRYRSTDRLLAAATHGRGLWTTTLPDMSCPPRAPSNITITSLTDTCGGRIYRYTAPDLTGTATGWKWSFVGTLASSGYIDSGSLTSQSMRAIFYDNAAATTGDSVRLEYTSDCGNGSRLAVKLTNTLLTAPAAPASITSALVSDLCGARIYRYTAPALSGTATGWQWSFVGTLGANATVDSGSLNSRVVKIKYTLSTAAAVGDSVRLAYTSGCGSSSRKSAMLTNLTFTAPTAPASITITTLVDSCGKRIYRYTAPALTSNVTGWQWSFVGSLGLNAVVDSGSLTSQIVRMKFTLNTVAAAGDSVRVRYTSNCGSSINRSLILSNASLSPSAPASITIASVKDSCGGRIYRYSAPALIGNASGWQWSFVGILGTNAVVDSGSLTSRIVRMKYSLNTASATGDSARVAYTNGCGNSINRSLVLSNTSLSPTAPLSITIASVRDTCGGRIYRYTAPALTGTATGWQWSFVGILGTNAVVDSGSLTSRIVRMKYSLNTASATGDSARVAYTSGCGRSTLRALKLTNTLLTAPTTAPLSITIASVRDTCGGRIYRYTAPALTGTATGWQWSFVGILGTNAVVDSGSLTSRIVRMKYSLNTAAATGDSARVAYTNGCGNSSLRTLKLTNTLLKAPTIAPVAPTITLVSTTNCKRVYRYSTTSPLTGTATGYLWTFVGSLGSTATLDSGTLNSRVVRMAFTNTSGAITDSARVVFTSGCGNSPVAKTKLTNTLLNCTPVKILPLQTNKVSANVMEAKFDVKVFPNPSTGVFNVQLQSAGKEFVLIRVVDSQGRLVEMLNAKPNANIMIGRNLVPGLYFLEVLQGNNKKSVKLLKE